MATKSPSEALTFLDGCTQHYDERTTEVYLNNTTDYECEIWFVQCKDLSGQIPPGFLDDTGVFVGETGGRPHEKYVIDPCIACHKYMPIQATFIDASCKLVRKDQNGNKVWEKDFNLDPFTASPGGYFGSGVGWRLYQGPQFDLETNPDDILISKQSSPLKERV